MDSTDNFVNSIVSDFFKSEASLSMSERDHGFSTDSNGALNNNSPNPSQVNQTDAKQSSQKPSETENFVFSKEDCTEDSLQLHLKDSDLQEEEPVLENSLKGKELSCDSSNSAAKRDEIDQTKSTGKLCEIVITSLKPLCADYQSDSDSESDEQKQSNSSGSQTDTATSTSSDSEFESDDSQDSTTVESKSTKTEKKVKGDISLVDLPLIENLKISVPEDACVEIGTVTSIVETLVIVESYKGTSALDIDTILFLDCGRQTLGKVFDILGPVSEPVYAVRFNSQEQIQSLNIKKDMKVYYAPKTEHTTFVFLSEILKNRGSDASWKDNAEAPPEFQDFSDDEEERRHKNKHTTEFNKDNPCQNEENKSRKRPFNKSRQSSGVFQGNRFRNPDFSHQRPYFQWKPSASQIVRPPSFPRTDFPGPVQIPPFPYVPPCSPANSHPRPPHLVFPPTFSGPPFHTFGSLPFPNQNPNFQQPFYQQRPHLYSQPFVAWGRPVIRPPPPPPPSNGQGDAQP